MVTGCEEQVFIRMLRGFKPFERARFIKFLESEYSDENFRFWIATEGLRNISDRNNSEGRRDLILRIVDEFIRPGTNNQRVNVEGKTAAAIIDAVNESIKEDSNIPINILDNAQREIFKLMQHDSYGRFLHYEKQVQESSILSCCYSNIVLLGSSGVGKTSFIKRSIYQEYDPPFNVTTGIEFHDSDTKVLSMKLWDTSGLENYRSVITSHLSRIQGAIIFFDITDESSFLSVHSWLSDIDRFCDANVVKVVVGNKNDLDNTRTLDKTWKNKLAELNIRFFKISTKTGQGIQEVMRAISKLVAPLYQRNLLGISDEY